MTYCTIEDVCGELHPTLEYQMRQHYDQLHEGNLKKPDFEQSLKNHIARAESCANASLARAFSVPLRQSSFIVTSATCKIAAYFSAAAFSEKEEILKDKYDTAMSMLDNLVKAGTIPGIDDKNQGENVGVRYKSRPQIFTDDELEKW